MSEVRFEFATLSKDLMARVPDVFAHEGRALILAVDDVPFAVRKSSPKMPGDRAVLAFIAALRGREPGLHVAAAEHDGYDLEQCPALTPRVFFALLLAAWGASRCLPSRRVPLGALRPLLSQDIQEKLPKLDSLRSWLQRRLGGLFEFASVDQERRLFGFGVQPAYKEVAFCADMESLIRSALTPKGEKGAPGPQRVVARAGPGVRDLKRFFGEYDEWITEEGSPDVRRPADLKVSVGEDDRGLVIEGWHPKVGSVFRSTVVAREPDQGLFNRILFTYQNYAQSRTLANPNGEARAHGLCVMDFHKHGFSGWFKSSVSRRRFFTVGRRSRSSEKDDPVGTEWILNEEAASDEGPGAAIDPKRRL